MQATISADIVGSTSLGKEDTVRLQEEMRAFLDHVVRTYPGSWGRVVRGDGLEIVVADARDVLRIALMLRYRIKSMSVAESNAAFQREGARVAIGLGGLRTNDREHGIIDGPAIYASGRALADMRREALSVAGAEETHREVLESLVMLLDALVSGATRTQCAAVYARLTGREVSEIMKQSRRTEPAVYSLLRNAGYPAIERTLKLFEDGGLLK